jgi:hypothetical protein
MSEHHSEDSWLDRNGTALVIVYGILFVTLIVSFHPFW